MPEPIRSKRLYQDIAKQLSVQIARGELRPGQRLPAERKLAASLNVSRPTIREAMIALEIAGLVEIRTGAGVFVTNNEKQDAIIQTPDIGPGPFELIEARIIFESEAAALAALRISEQELLELDKLCSLMAERVEKKHATEDEDRQFHHLIASATRNNAVIFTVDQLWSFRTRMPMWRKLHALIGEMEGTPDWTDDSNTILDHKRIVNALRTRDPDTAREAMQLHLNHVRDALLKASELDSIDLNNFDLMSEPEASK